MSKTQGRTLLLLHILLLFYSLSDVMSKLAAGFDFLSLGFVVCYSGLLLILAGYAIGWQQVIKRMPLTTAYANRGITVVWGIFWGALFFSEAVTPGKIAGAVMVVAGIVLFSLADGEKSEEVSDGE
jgi:multidrug transporter EmrE-like cation transporter